jgi:hypothetical protein
MIYLRITALALALLCFGSSLARSAFADEKEIYVAIDSFTWREFGDDGSRLLKELGPIVGIGFAYWSENEHHVTLRPTAEIFVGTVNYDGHACDSFGNCQPAKTQVDYFGFKLEGDLGRRFRPYEGLYLEPFGGLGYRAWLRNIRNGTAADGSPTAGYMEDWKTFYARLGLRGGREFSEASRFFAEAGMKLPLYNENTAYLSKAGLGSDVTFNPGKMVSYFAEAGVKINRFKWSLFYDGLRFSKSNTVQSGIYLYWQPKSTMDIYGLKLGYTF